MKAKVTVFLVTEQTVFLKFAKKPQHGDGHFQTAGKLFDFQCAISYL